jgi:hypothetical protein
LQDLRWRRQRFLAALAPLLVFLALDALARDRASCQPLFLDRLPAVLAHTESPFVDALERLLDFPDQLAIAIAQAQVEIAPRLERCAIVGIGVVLPSLWLSRTES